MKIGILGTRGVPNAYGGFEQFAQYLSLGLVQRGHSVWVYNSSDHPYKEKDWNGVHIVHCMDMERHIGTAGQFIYDLNCLRDARKRNFDVLLQLGYTSNSIWGPLWPKGTINLVNMDGLEWRRSKYGALTRRFLKRAEGWAARRGDLLIADSIGIQDYLKQEYHRPSIYIPYGAEIPSDYDAAILQRWGLEPGKYFLLIARMEPENNIEMIISGWMASRRDIPLILVGNPGNPFGRKMMDSYQDERLRFLGAIYEAPVVHSLRKFSALYFHGHSVGGTNPSLLEAMACECAIAAHNNAFNKSVLGEEALYFSNAEEVREIMKGHIQALPAWKEKNLEKVKMLYNWDKIIDDYEKVMYDKSGHTSL